MAEPRKIVPVVRAQDVSRARAAPTAHLTDHGGPILSAVEVYTVFWGSAWQSQPQHALIGEINQFFDYILSSPLMDLMAEYGRAGQPIGHGHRTGTKTVTTSEPGQPVPGGRQIDDAAIQQTLSAWTTDGTLPAPNANTLYFLYFPPNVTVTLDGDASCDVFCGYHNQVDGTIFYAVEPYITCAGCDFGQVVDSLTKVSSHELCEAVTDPSLDAWWDDHSQEEIGDICNVDIHELGGYTIQSEWSNAANGCVITPSRFRPVYRQGDPGTGIGGYDLGSPADQVLPFDYDSSGKLDHLVLYRPHTGTIWILKNTAGSFTPVYRQGDPGAGIGGYDLKSPADRAFAFDYDGSGKLDHLVLYRPGTGTIWILKNTGGTFTPVYREGGPGNGIGGYDLRSPVDQAFAFDYDGSGKLDHLVLYRPGRGTFWILENSGGFFGSVIAEGDPGAGVGGYDLKSPADRLFAFDYDGSGKLDHLALYRPGTGTFWILANSYGDFTPAYEQGDPGAGIGGYDLKSPADRAFAFDYDGSGKLDHLALYRAGTGAFWILESA